MKSVSLLTTYSATPTLESPYVHRSIIVSISSFLRSRLNLVSYGSPRQTPRGVALNIESSYHIGEHKGEESYDAVPHGRFSQHPELDAELESWYCDWPSASEFYERQCFARHDSHERRLFGY